MYGLSQEEMSSEELFDFKLAYKRGKAAAKKKAVDHLFNSMSSTRGGKEACMEYLEKFADNWREDESGKLFDM
jgi:hypothetical protein